MRAQRPQGPGFTAEAEADDTGARPATVADIGALTVLLSDVFHNDPVMRWAVPDEPKRRAATRAFFSLHLRHCVPHGGVHVSHDMSTTLVSLPSPAEKSLDSDATPDEYRRAMGPDGDPILEVMNLLDRHRPESQERYVHVSFACSSPAGRGPRAVSAVARHAVAAWQRGGWAAYSEASSPGGFGALRHMGFQPVGEPVRLPGDGPRLTPMWRPVHHP
jgi:hypothetical protein